MSGAHPEIAEDKMEVRRQSISRAFLVDIMKTLMDHPDMTATQVLQLAQERGALVTPAMGRQQSEFLGVIIEREIDILAHAGQFPPMPPELLAVGGAIKIEYSSPLNQLQRAQDGVGIMQTIQQLSPLAEAGHQEVFDFIDFDWIGPELAEINGAPAKMTLSPEKRAALAQQKAQQAQAQALIEAAPQAASAAKDIATAHATAMNAPQPQPGIGM